MGETSLSALFAPVRLLLLGYGHVARSFLPLLATRSKWLEHHLAIQPVISGIGSRSQGLYIYPPGIDAGTLSREQDALGWFKEAGERVEDAEEFIQAGKAAGTSLLIELTILNPHSGQPAGSPIHLVSQAHREQGVLTAEVRPRNINTDDILHIGRGPTSVISLETEAMGTITLVEHESTTLQTAYGVLSDLITILQRRHTV